MKNYKLTDETKTLPNGVILKRIELTQDCKWGKKGEKGGWIEKEENLKDNARVSDNAHVYGDALVSDNARVYKQEAKEEAKEHTMEELTKILGYNFKIKK